MATDPASPLVRQLRKLIDSQTAREHTDQDLLQRFAGQHDETAFAALVQRHGQVVWGLCRRLLGHEQDAEDAFQATFLILARKATTIRKQEALGSWLYGVASRVARNARKSAARRRGRERLGEARPQQQPVTEAALREVQALLDEEVGRLPEKYRAPFVLCCLEGRSKAEAAAELGWKEGTVSSRLAFARRRLQHCLARRGVALPAALAAVAVGQDATSAAMPTLLLNAALRGAAGAVPEPVAALAKGVLRSMTLLKLRAAAAVLVAACVVLATGAALLPQATGDRPAPQAAEPSPLAGGAGEAAAIWQPRLQLRGEFGHARMDFAPDGRTLFLLAGERGRLRFLDTATWQERGVVRLDQLYPAGFQVAASFSPDGRQLAVVGWRARQDDPIVTLIDVPSAKTGRTFAGLDPAFSPDGKLLATIGEKKVQLWDPTTVKEHATWPIEEERGEARSTRRLVFAPDGQYLAWSHSGTVRLWDVRAGRERLRTEGFLPATQPFSPDGRTFATAGPDRVVRLWDAASGKQRLALPPATLPSIHLGFLPDGKSLLTVEHYAHGNPGGSRKRPAQPPAEPVVERPVGVKLWDVATGKERLTLPGTILGQNWAGVSPDGHTLAYRCGSDHDDTFRVVLWDLAANKELHTLPVVGGQFTPDGKGFWATTRTVAIPSLWDVASGKKELSLAQETGRRLTTIAFAPDGRFLALATWPGAQAAPPGTPVSDVPVQIAVWQLAAGPVPLDTRGRE
jgi:RNA polymerase sigma factor (sigma-70 family)